MYRLIIHRRAASYLQKLPFHQQEPLKAALKRLADNPFNSPHIKAMVGEWQGYYRLRVQNQRVIYWLDRENLIIYVDYVGPRGDIYKQ